MRPKQYNFMKELSILKLLHGSNLGPVIQNTVNLKLLFKDSIRFPAYIKSSTYKIMLILFAKNVGSFCIAKSPHTFFGKIMAVFVYNTSENI